MAKSWYLWRLGVWFKVYVGAELKIGKDCYNLGLTGHPQHDEDFKVWVSEVQGSKQLS